MPTRKKNQEVEAAENAGSVQPQDPQTSANLDQLQQVYSSEYTRYLKIVEQGRLAQQQRCADAYNELLAALQGIRQEVVTRGTEAYRTYADVLQSSTGSTETYDKGLDAYHTYLNAVQQVADSRSKAEENAVQVYQEYMSAVESGQDQAEIQRLGENAQKAYLDANTYTADQKDLLQGAADAQANFYRILQESQTSNQQAAVDAFQTYVGQVQASMDEINIQERYQAALQRYQSRLNEITTTSQRIILDANTKALRELRTAWEAIIGGAIDLV